MPVRNKASAPLAGGFCIGPLPTYAIAAGDPSRPLDVTALPRMCPAPMRVLWPSPTPDGEFTDSLGIRATHPTN